MASLISGSLFADTEIIPVPSVYSSEGRNYYFKMIPAKYEYKNDKFEITREAFGKAYELKEDGSSRLLWQVKGWYSHEVFLSGDGEYLVRMGDWPDGLGPSTKDLAIAFYHKGKLVKKYSTADLIQDKEKVIQTASHYIWLSEEENYAKMHDFDYSFNLTTIEKNEFIFDYRNGDIIEILNINPKK